METAHAREDSCVKRGRERREDKCGMLWTVNKSFSHSLSEDQNVKCSSHSRGSEAVTERLQVQSWPKCFG